MVSSEDLTTRTVWLPDTQSFVKRVKKERRKHAALCSTSVKNNKFGKRVVDHDRLRAVKKKVESPVTDGWMSIQRYKFVKQFHRNYGVKGRAKVLEKNPRISTRLFQVLHNIM